MARTSKIIAERKQGQTRAEIVALLELAKNEGGALGEVAEEMLNPKRSMLATMGEGFKNSFRTFVDVLQTPSNIVAGIISPDLTVQEAMKKNTSVSSVLFGKSPEGFQFQDVGRFAVDVLTDPLSYVTFGASKGILGITAFQKTRAGKVVAEKLGLEEGADVALSNAGEATLDKIIGRQRAGMRHDYLVNERIRIADEIMKAGGKVDEADMIAQLNKIDEAANDALIERSLNRRLDRKTALESMSLLLERNPALIETLVDKGGIKLFSKSILSAQRIRDTKNLIPGMALLDHAWEPVRRSVYPLFSTGWTSAGKVSSITQTVVQDALDKKNSAWADLMVRAQTYYQKGGVTEQEASMINTAMTARKEPADPKLAKIYNELMYGGKTGELSPAGKAARFSSGQEVRNLRMMRAAGVPVNEIENHTTHLLTNGYGKKGIRNRFATETDAAKMRSINGFLNVATGEEMIGRAEKTTDGLKFKIGKEGLESINLKSGRIEGSKDRFYFDADGTIYKRFTVSAKEAKEVMDVDFEENQLLLTTVGSMEAIRVAVANDFLRDLTKMSGRPASIAPSHWVPIDVTRYQKELGDMSNFLKGTNEEELMFHPADAKMVENFFDSFAGDETISNLWKNFDRLQNVFKASVTSIWPAFHGRNAISNVFLHFLDIGVHSLNPANHALVGNIIAKEFQYSNLMKKADLGDEAAKETMFEMENKVVFQDKYNYDWTWGELRSRIREHVVAFNPNITGLVDFSRTPREMAEHISRGLKRDTLFGKGKQLAAASNPLSQDFIGYRAGRVAGSLVEDHARLMDFIVNLRKTGDVGLSAIRTKQFLFDYSNLTKFEKEFMRRVIPFYTFMRKNMELQVATMFTTPGRISAELHAIESIGEMLGAENLSEEERAQLPEWMRDKALIVTGKKNGILEVITGLETPIESLFKMTKPNQIIASVSPLIRTPVELGSGYSFFHAKEISDLTNARYFEKAPGPIKEFIGYHEVKGEREGKPFTYAVSLRPHRMHFILNLPPSTRVFTTLGNVGEKDVSGSSKWLEAIFGLRANAVDLELESERREKELKRQLEDLLTNAKVGYTFQRYVAPDDN